ncbi:MFS transporter [Sulfitobacter sp. S190]|uniref:MFS transporter n=1 Tax=Sulfitobacter sp. S190 TaxID=2867022 RepID=UPI0021A2F639|nr:MFS transporter [Sulfitobacter sp. S190]UWR22103.1 MFS transporter [Sulfitobacter sp. S190]
MSLSRNIALYPWLKFCHSLLFWQAIWFLYFQDTLSGAQAIALYAVYDIATTVLEVPSGYMSDRLGRRVTIIAGSIAGLVGAALIGFADVFWLFVVAQCCIGASSAFMSGTDSALLYESLEADGRNAEVEAQELRAWRFTFSGFALSGITGGAMALWAPTLPFFATTLAFVAATAIALQLREPPRSAPVSEAARLQTLKRALVHPVLLWFLALAMLMYGFSHLPFVFGQPFILTALDQVGLGAEAPLVSGAVSSAMMLVSVAVSLVAVRLKERVGIRTMLLGAFALQVALVGALTVTTSALAIAVLLLRMVPNALSQPFILARIQPLLHGESRATYLSLQSLAGKLLFAATLFAAAGTAADAGALPSADLQRILGWYAIAGMICLLLLAIGARRVTLDVQKTE